MASAVTICSNALLRLGAKSISSFDGPATINGLNRAQLCAAIWPTTRDSILRAHPWNCATRRVVLAPLSSSPAFEYTNQFALPGDFLRALSINQYTEDKFDYALESNDSGRVLLCNESAIYLRYIWRNENIDSWDSMLIECAELAVMAAIALPITESTTTRDSVQQELIMKLRGARSVDGQENPPETLGDFPLLAARYSLGGG